MSKIISGFKNLIIKDEEIEKLSKERMDICNECPFLQNIAGVKICGWCLCVLEAKTRSKESECPIGNWK